jgi:hypothetical protein
MSLPSLLENGNTSQNRWFQPLVTGFALANGGNESGSTNQVIACIPEN